MSADAPEAMPLTDAALSRSAAAHEKHPLLLVLARAVWPGASAEHKAAIEEALGDHGRGKEFLEPPKPAEPERYGRAISERASKDFDPKAAADARAAADKAEADRNAALMKA